MSSRSKLILKLAMDSQESLPTPNNNNYCINKKNEKNRIEINGIDRHISTSDALNRTREWAKTSFFNNIDEPIITVPENIEEGAPKKIEHIICDTNSDCSIILETTMDSCSSRCSDQETNYINIESLFLNKPKYNNVSISPVLHDMDNFIVINNCTNENVENSSPPEFFELKRQTNICELEDRSKEDFNSRNAEFHSAADVQGIINDNNIPLNYGDNTSVRGDREIISDYNNYDSDGSYTTIDDEDKDKDYHIDEHSKYSSSSDDETVSDEEDESYLEREGSKNKIKEIKDLTKNISEPILPLDRRQRKLESTKKETRCKFCNVDIMSKNFVRHIETFHRSEDEVKKILTYPKKSKERRQAFGLLRHDTNFDLYVTGITRPCRKAKILDMKSFYPCIYCKGLYKKEYLKRHTISCKANRGLIAGKSKNYISDSQTLTACAIDPTNVISKLNVKQQVFSIMKGDEIAFEAKKDLLIVHFGESYLKQHKRERKEYACSNRMRELSRLLIAYRQITQNTSISLKEILIPKNFDNVLAAARHISGYDPSKKVFGAPSLAMHMGTYLKVVCDELYHLILKENSGFKCKSKEDMQNWQQDIKNFKKLLTTRWNTEISSLANKDLQEKRWNKPLLVPLVSDIQIFRNETLKIAFECQNKFKDYEDDVESYKLLVNCTLSLLILFNRRRIGDVQYLKIKDYCNTPTSNFNDFENVLTSSEKLLTKKYKRVVNSGKGSRAVVILVPQMLQKLISTLLKSREKYISNENEYVFALPHSKIKWGQGDVAIRSLAKKFDLKHPEAITSNKLRKHIATVAQILNLSKEESKQFSKFMGHTEKTHAEFYELPVDIYQTAKVSKLLLMMEKGKLPIEYKGKSLEEIDINIDFPEDNEGDDDVPNIGLNKTLPSSSAANDQALRKKEKPADLQKDSDTENEPFRPQEVDLFEDHEPKNKKRKKVQKKGWSKKELDLLKSTFKDFIRKEIYPSGKAIQEFISNTGIDRTVTVIKAKIQHLIKQK